MHGIGEKVGAIFELGTFCPQRTRSTVLCYVSAGGTCTGPAHPQHVVWRVPVFLGPMTIAMLYSLSVAHWAILWGDCNATIRAITVSKTIHTQIINETCIPRPEPLASTLCLEPKYFQHWLIHGGRENQHSFQSRSLVRSLSYFRISNWIHLCFHP